jgi:hypothetical protein
MEMASESSFDTDATGVGYFSATMNRSFSGVVFNAADSVINGLSARQQSHREANGTHELYPSSGRMRITDLEFAAESPPHPADR